MNTSYSRFLAGDRRGYSAYWSLLLREAAGASGRVSMAAGEEWSWKPELPRVGEPVVVELQTAAGLPQAVMGGAGGSASREAVVYLAQDAVLPFYWRGRYWPETAGWQTAYQPMGDTTWWWAWPAGAWKGVDRERRRVETLAFTRSGKIGSEAAVKGGEMIREKAAIPQWWFWGLFLLGAVFLWVERKMGGMNGEIPT